MGSIIEGNKEINEDVTNQIDVGWIKWRLSLIFLTDKKVQRFER